MSVYRVSGLALVFALSLASAALADPTPYTYSGPVVPIPDGLDTTGAHPGAAAVAPVTVAGFTGRVGVVTATIDGLTCTTAAGSTAVGIDHTYVGDLVLTLRSPAGTAVTLMSRSGDQGRNICQLTFDDTSYQPIQGVSFGRAPFGGVYRPASVLSAFAGENPNGTWTLEAQDYSQGDTGNIRAFTVNIEPAPPIPTLTQWMMGLLVAALAGLGGLAVWRQGRPLGLH